MFAQLQQDATHIDMGIRSLNAKMASVMTGYTRNNPDAAAALHKRHTGATALSRELRKFLGEAQQLAGLVAESRAAVTEIEAELGALADAEGLQSCVVVVPLERDVQAEADTSGTAEGVDAICIDDDDSEKGGEEAAGAENSESCNSNNDSPMICIARNRASIRFGEADATPAIRSQKRKTPTNAGAGLFKNVHRNLHF